MFDLSMFGSDTISKPRKKHSSRDGLTYFAEAKEEW